MTTGWGGLGAVPLPVPPKVLRPLVYCEFRTSSTEVCTLASSEVLEGMSLCFRHAEDVRRFLAEEDARGS